MPVCMLVWGKADHSATFCVSPNQGNALWTRQVELEGKREREAKGGNERGLDNVLGTAIGWTGLGGRHKTVLPQAGQHYVF